MYWTYSISWTTTGTGIDGVATPLPIQTCMTSNCNSSYKVGPGNDYISLATAARTGVAEIEVWNPDVAEYCLHLFEGYYACIGVTV